MSELNGGEDRMRVILGTVLGGVIAALASFVGSARAGLPPSGNAEFDAGQAVGYGLAFGLVVCAVTYFLALRRAKGAQKWIMLAIVVVCAVVGASVGASLQGAISVRRATAPRARQR